MKKIAKIIAVILLFLIFIFIMTVFCSCNAGIGPGNFAFSNVHICDFNGNCNDLSVETWYDSEGPGIEVKTKENGSLFLSEGTYILYNDVCPICSNKKGE